MKHTTLILVLIAIFSFTLQSFRHHKYKPAKNRQKEYSIKDTTVSIIYKIERHKRVSSFISKGFKTANDSICIIRVHVFDDNPIDTAMRKIGYANVLLKGYGGTSRGVTCNGEGVANLSIPQTGKEDSVFVSYIGYPRKKIPVKLDKDYIIEVNMGYDPPKLMY